MNTGNRMSVSTAIFYGKVKKKRTELALPADESEDENDVDWTADESSDGDISADEELQVEAEEGIVPATEERDQEEVRAALCPPFQKPKNLKWRKKRSTAAVPEWKGSLPHAGNVKEPIEYFRCLLSRNIIEEMVFQSNLYAIQCYTTMPLNATFEEMEQFLDMCFTWPATHPNVLEHKDKSVLCG